MDRYSEQLYPLKMIFVHAFIINRKIFFIAFFLFLLSILQVCASSPISVLQLVESTFLWQLHDLPNNEAGACDGIRLNPPGLDSVLGVKRQQYAMYCDPIEGEIKPVCLIRTL